MEKKNIDNSVLRNLLTDFDEMGFEPITLCKNPEEYARKWRNALTEELQYHEKRAVVAFAEKVKRYAKEHWLDSFQNDLNVLIDRLFADEQTPDLTRTPINKVTIGQRFKYCGKEFVKLDKYDEHIIETDGDEPGYLCLAADVWFNACFDKEGLNNWETSSLRKELATRIVEFIPEENLIPFDRDLTTDDGMTEYGSCTDVVSLLTCDEYRKYRKLIPNCGKWHWTITADSREYSYPVRLVTSGGGLDDYYAYSGSRGVRPLCVLKSDTLVEIVKEEEKE